VPRSKSGKPCICISKIGFIKECMLMNNITSTQFDILIDAIHGPTIQHRTGRVYILFQSKEH
jgi:hypothetical protein